MSEALVLAVPSKGRLKEQVEAWFADCGLELAATGGERGYSAMLRGLPQVQVRLLSAGDIAAALDSGDVHLGVTGEDLLRERTGAVDERVLLLRPLGFGRADLVVAVPKTWLDVETMADLDEVSHDILARSGRRMRVATKYVVQTRGWFARHGLSDYRIAESGGATEGAPAAGAAELVVDITTTGATLAANGLKVLRDGVMLKSQAQLAASLTANWGGVQLDAAERLLRIVEARAAAREAAILAWPESERGEAAAARLVAGGAERRPNGVLVRRSAAAAAAASLAADGIGPVSVTRPEFVYAQACDAMGNLRSCL